MKKLISLIFVLCLSLSVVKAYDEAQIKQILNRNYGGKIMSEAREVRASHILVGTEQEANDLKARIEAGESFADLAKQYSSCPSGKSGGDLGYFKKGQMVKPFEDAAFSLPVNKVSNPVKTQFGYHLIEVTDRK